jgi:hypothetical protein
MASDEDILEDARDAFTAAADCESDNRKDALDDLTFARLNQQWPAAIAKQRADDGRPALTINKLPGFIRQVVNDSRQNKPSIKVHPVDSMADPITADIYSGLIRNIEYSSHADVAYDTAVDSAVSMGWGYFRIGLDYAYDTSFDMELSIDRVADPFLVYGDPRSFAADSSDWNSAFVIERLTKKQFEDKYKGSEAVNWETQGYVELGEPWFTEDGVMLAEWWTREEVERDIILMSDGSVLDAETYDKKEELRAFYALQGITEQARRTSKSYKVTQRLLTGKEILEENVWPGRYIPIVPVYGDEVVVEGKRHLRSLIRDAKDPQRMFNYWRTASTELVALAPRTPFIGKKGSFVTDAHKWATANTQSHAYIEYDGAEAPARQGFVGPPAGALQEALNAADDMKSVMGLYDASLGARSNETSGIAIARRQGEGDVSTFHFIDNMARAIRCAGMILIDVIPKVYGKRQILRILGPDGVPQMVPMRTPQPVLSPQGQPMLDPMGVAMTRINDLNVGKYDLTVSSGPSFTTKRQEAAAQMTEMVRAFPAAAPVIGDLIAKNLDWPGADEIAKRLSTLAPQGQQIPPELQKAIQQGQEKIAQLTAENQQLKADQSNAIIRGRLEAQNQEIEQQRLVIDSYRAQTERAKQEAEQLKTQLESADAMEARATAQNNTNRHGERLEAIHAAINALVDTLSRPRKVVRGADGKMEGVI